MEGQTMTVGDLWALWGRRWRALMVGLLAGTLVGLGAAALSRPTFSATAVVVVTPISVSPFSSGQASGQINMASERSTVTSWSVLERAVTLLDGERADAGAAAPDSGTLRQALDVSVPSGSLVLNVRVATDDPATSSAWSNAVAAAYLDYRSQSAADATRRIAEQIDADVKQVVASRAAAPAADRGVFDQELVRLRDRQRELSTVPLNPGTTVSSAQPAQGPSSPGRLVFVVAGAALGLFAGAALALVRDRRDSRVRHRGWAHNALPGAVLGVDRDMAPHARRVLALAVASPRVVLVSADGPMSGQWAEALADQARALGRDPRVERLSADAGVGAGMSPERLFDATRPVDASAPDLPCAIDIVDASAVRDATVLAWVVRPGDLVVVELAGSTRRAAVRSIAAELAVVGREVGYVAFRPRKGWAAAPLDLNAPPMPGDEPPAPEESAPPPTSKGTGRARTGRPWRASHREPARASGDEPRAQLPSREEAR